MQEKYEIMYVCLCQYQPLRSWFLVDYLTLLLFMVYTPFLLFRYNQLTTLVPNQEKV